MNNVSFTVQQSRKKRIKDIDEGQVIYVVPWAVMASPNWCVYINGRYGFTDVPGGTSEVRVKKQNGNYYIDRQTIDESEIVWSRIGDDPAIFLAAIADFD
jgi:hypothetical protein